MTLELVDLDGETRSHMLAELEVTSERTPST